ncbi:MAG: hypothetical protein ACJLUP_10735 [Agrobacterium tumefaciens]
MATITASADVELSLVMVGLSSKCRFDNFTLLTRWPLMIALMTPAGAKVPFSIKGAAAFEGQLPNVRHDASLRSGRS